MQTINPNEFGGPAIIIAKGDVTIIGGTFTQHIHQHSQSRLLVAQNDTRSSSPVPSGRHSPACTSVLLADSDFDAAFAQFSTPQTNPQTKGSDPGDPEFSRIWQELQRESATSASIVDQDADMKRWEAEFNELMKSSLDDFGQFGQEWSNLHNPFLQDPSDVGPYTFEEDNPYLDNEQAHTLMDRAKAQLHENTLLKEATLMLEAAIQLGKVGEGGYEAWILLGETLSMDDFDLASIRALIEGVKRSEKIPGTKGVGMLSLAVAYTNEGYDHASHRTLLRWFCARYPEVHVPEATKQRIHETGHWGAHEVILGLFLELARSQHRRGIIDADLQVALGVLSHVDGDYEKAADCFSTAVGVRPKDYLLWNRLGASLANGGKAELSLNAYREALTLRPTYTKAIYNVGVACLNIGAHKEAAEHFLAALELQSFHGNASSSTELWNTLRRTLSHLDDRRLLNLCESDPRPDLNVFREHGLEF